MSKLMIVGCGGVASVAIQKCCQNSEVFDEIMIASRTLSKCEALKEKLQPTTKTRISTGAVDANDMRDVSSWIKTWHPDAVLNVALPYQDLTIMDACLDAGVHYIDTANYERRTRKIPDGEPSMRNGANVLALPLISIIPGSGLIRISLKKPV